MNRRTLPFWIRRRFVELPDEEFDALHEAAHARAISRLKFAAAVLGGCSRRGGEGRGARVAPYLEGCFRKNTEAKNNMNTRSLAP